MKLTTFLRKFDTDEACRAHMESVRWPEGPVCPRCGTIDQATPIPTRSGLYRCGACRKQFTVTVGTAMEGTNLPLSGIIEADETYLGGKARNRQKHRDKPGRGRGTSSPMIFAAIERGGEA